MDQNIDDLVAYYASLALLRMLDGDAKSADEWLRKLPRGQRGRVNKALEDVSMSLSRLGP